VRKSHYGNGSPANQLTSYLSLSVNFTKFP
jgi:hypothetical protein